MKKGEVYKKKSGYTRRFVPRILDAVALVECPEE